MEVYDYKSYREYLSAKLAELGRGSQRRLAEGLKCDPSFLSQVLNNKQNLSQEQGLAAAKFLKLRKYESRYFLKLIDIDRAGSVDLKKLYADELKEMRQQIFADYRKKGEFSGSDLQKEFFSRFYNGWAGTAIYAALAIPGLNTIDVLSKSLNISAERVEESLNHLLDFEIVRKEGENYFLHKTGFISPKRGHFQDEIRSYHNSWRLKLADRFLNEKSEEDINATYVAALTNSQYFELRERLREILTSSMPSKGEEKSEVVAFSVDLVKLTSDQL